MTTAIVLINTDIGAEEEVFEQLKKVDNVSEAYIVYGVYDIIAKVEAPSLDQLKDTITNKIRRLPKVRSTLTMIVVEGKEFKR